MEPLPAWAQIKQFGFCCIIARMLKTETAMISLLPRLG